MCWVAIKRSLVAMSPLPAASREPRYHAPGGLLRHGGQQRLRLKQPPPPPSRWKGVVGSVRRSLHVLFNWSGWPRLAAIATALTAVAALWFSARSLGSTEKQYTLSQQTQLTDRFTRAVEQLGSDKPDIRLGGIYSLERIARDSLPYQSVIVEVLNAYVRTHAGKRTGCATNPGVDTDIQAVLTVIARRAPNPEFPELVDLRYSCLPFAGLNRGRLDGAYLEATTLTGAFLGNANLAGAVLKSARLDDAQMAGADLSRADLTLANLRNARLNGADLTRAVLTGARMRGADLSEAKLVDVYYDARFTEWPEGFIPPPSRTVE